MFILGCHKLLGDTSHSDTLNFSMCINKFGFSLHQTCTTAASQRVSKHTLTYFFKTYSKTSEIGHKLNYFNLYKILTLTVFAVGTPKLIGVQPNFLIACILYRYCFLYNIAPGKLLLGSLTRRLIDTLYRLYI